MSSCYNDSCVIAFSLAFCLVSLHLAVAGYERSCTTEDFVYSRNVGVCGSQLSRLLSHICGIKGYNKRSTGEPSMLLSFPSFSGLLTTEMFCLRMASLDNPS